MHHLKYPWLQNFSFQKLLIVQSTAKSGNIRQKKSYRPLPLLSAELWNQFTTVVENQSRNLGPLESVLARATGFERGSTVLAATIYRLWLALARTRWDWLQIAVGGANHCANGYPFQSNQFSIPLYCFAFVRWRKFTTDCINQNSFYLILAEGIGALEK